MHPNVLKGYLNRGIIIKEEGIVLIKKQAVNIASLQTFKHMAEA